MPTKAQPSKKRVKRTTPEGVAFGRALVYYRGVTGMTQEQLGWASDVSRPHLAELELGLHEPQFGMFLRLALALKVTPGELADTAFQELRKEQRRRKTATRTPPARASE